MATIFESKRHDTAIGPVLTFTPPAGLDWDLTDDGITALFIARLPDATLPKISKPAVITGPWQIRYDPEPEDVDTIGTYDVEVEIHRADTKQVTLPTKGFLSWVIGTDLNNA